jgi:glycosyltransferase involved in cell wall biosynthesis
MISVLILTKNEQQDLPDCLASVNWCDDVHVYDSFSTDNTLSIAKQFGANITQRIFDNWSAHQNWGLHNIKFKYNWVLYIDADERVSNKLKDNLLNFNDTHTHVAFEIRRNDYAWNGKQLKHVQFSPLFLRLFRPEKIHYERLVNPLTVPNGTVGFLDGVLNHFPFSKGIIFWLQRHVKYAELEALTRLGDFETKRKFSLYKAIFSKDFTEKRYHQKGIFYMLPLRPLIKWIYMVFLKMGFLDGNTGITYATLQSIYEYFIVLKTRELLKSKSSKVV